MTKKKQEDEFLPIQVAIGVSAEGDQGMPLVFHIYEDEVKFGAPYTPKDLMVALAVLMDLRVTLKKALYKKKH